MEYDKLTLHELFVSCLEEINGHCPKDSIERRVATADINPVMARQLFFLTKDKQLGLIFVAKYQNDNDYGESAYTIAQELDLSIEKEMFNIPEKRPNTSVSAFSFLEDDFRSGSASEIKMHPCGSAYEIGNWSGAFDNAVRVLEEHGY